MFLGSSNKSDISIIKPLFLIESAKECNIGDKLVVPFALDSCNAFNNIFK